MSVFMINYQALLLRLDGQVDGRRSAGAGRDGELGIGDGSHLQLEMGNLFILGEAYGVVFARKGGKERFRIHGKVSAWTREDYSTETTEQS